MALVAGAAISMARFALVLTLGRKNMPPRSLLCGELLQKDRFAYGESLEAVLVNGSLDCLFDFYFSEICSQKFFPSTVTL